MLMSDCFFYNRKTAYEMRISDWSSDVCSSNLLWATRTKSGARAGIYGGEIHRESCGKSGSAKRAQGHVGDGAPARFQLRLTAGEVAFGDSVENIQQPLNSPLLDRKSVVYGKSVSVRVDLGGCRIIQKQKKTRHR